MNKQLVIDSVEKYHGSAGSWCCYVKIDDHTGVKFYGTPEERDVACVTQECAAEIGCGPKVGECIDMMSPPNINEPYHRQGEFSKNMIFGYVTESIEFEGIEPEDWRELNSKLSQHGIYLSDWSDFYNCGYDRNGNAVAIDFDPTFSLKRVFPEFKEGWDAKKAQR